MKTIITSVIVAVLAFYGGVQYGSHVPGATALKSGIEARLSVPSARGDFKNVLGEVVSAEDSVLTLKDAKDAVTKVSVATSTAISKNISLKLSDLKPGFKVVASGIAGANGLMTAVFLNVVREEAPIAPVSTSTRTSK